MRIRRKARGILLLSTTFGGRAVPLYEYQCAKCGKKTEKIENVSGPHLKKCPHCGGKVERVVSAPAIQFKGSGWYVTDYAGKSSAKEPGKSPESSGGDKKESSGSDSSPKDKTSKENKEKKPAKKN
jgi:putative FmdB family regulatory protein